MEICYVAFENPLTLIKNNQKILITPFLTGEDGNIKMGIDAPNGVSVDREEIYIRKQKNAQLSEADSSFKIQQIFKLLFTVTYKSELLEKTAKRLFNKDKILTPTAILKVSKGEAHATAWLVSCAVNILIHEKCDQLKDMFPIDDIFHFWAKPLLKTDNNYEEMIATAQRLKIPELIERINTSDSFRYRRPESMIESQGM
ncbi:carbon storage regulator [Legionella drancourtii]|nr:carbon storage regulator [Legionella drancourtii]